MDNPAFVRETCRSVLADYNRARGEERSRSCRLDVVQPEKPASGVTQFQLGSEDFPDEDITLEGVEFLVSTWDRVRARLRAPLPEVEDGRGALVEILRRHVLAVASTYLHRTILFLACDRRYHPEGTVRIDAVDLLSERLFNLPTRLESMAQVAALCRGAFPDRSPPTLLADELRVLGLAGGVFFDTLDAAFDLKAGRKCRTAFDLMLLTVGEPTCAAMVADYVRRHRALYRALVGVRENGGAVSSPTVDGGAVRALERKVQDLERALSANTQAVAENSRTVANMDRRQRTLLATMKAALAGFVKLFRPAAPAPTRERVAAALTPSDRYACLVRIAEPHRSQLKAVIDLTERRPIVLRGRTRDDFTLSRAARVVWDKNGKDWSKVPGAFETFDQLKAACYNLQGRADDPFYYRT